MLLLAVDTSGKYGSIALCRCEGGSCEALDVVPISGGTFSAQLVPQIADLLSRHKLTKFDLDGFVAASGPGSFTGLRVGLAAIKALAEVLDKPIATVSLLEAAASFAGSGRVLAALDAGRNEVYVGEYEVDGGQTLIQESLVGREDFLRMAHGQRVITPDQNISDLTRQAEIKTQYIGRPHADVVARLGWTKIQTGRTVSPADLEANYIRRSDAEIFSKPVI